MPTAKSYNSIEFYFVGLLPPRMQGVALAYRREAVG